MGLSRKILVIDDEANIIKVVQTRLEKNGYTVISANDGQEGIEKALAEKPDLIILDILMPEMDGYEAARRMRANKELDQIPIIMLTAKDRMQELFSMEGVNDYIIKPFIAEDLLNCIRKHLDK